MIIGILIFVVFAILLAQAILETILGTCMIIQSLFWHSIAAILEGLALVLDGFRLIKKSFTGKALPAKARA